jgi:hypothetical protein
MTSQKLLCMEAFLEGINEVLDRGFATEEIHAHLQRTLIEPDSLQRYIFFSPGALHP